MQSEISEIANRIRELREVCDYATAQLAKELGISEETYIGYETEGNFPISTIYEISKMFKVDFTELVTGSPARLDTYHVVRRGLPQLPVDLAQVLPVQKGAAAATRIWRSVIPTRSCSPCWLHWIRPMRLLPW